MSRLLAFDGRTGASGDMILGALVAAGADPAVLAPVTDAIDVSYGIDRIDRRGVAATAVTVVGDDSGGNGSDHEHDHGDGAGHADHDHDGREPAEGHGPARTYDDVLDVLAGMDLPPGVADDATATFERLGRAEAAVHGTDLGETAFHEVGADDAIADVVGAALLVDDLDPDRVVTTPPVAGGGEVAFSHGVYPVPTPAVVAIAEDADWELRGGPADVETELLTPTGAAILAEFAEGVASLPPVRVHATGYGAGDRDLPERPNVLRALVGEGRGSLVREGIRVLETNVDDVSPEVLGGLQETLAEAGARDVSILPTTMKKSRPGHLVKAIVREADADRVARRLAVETGSLGVRDAGVTHRFVARRRMESVTVEIGGDEHEVAVKVATDDEGATVDVSAEYDDAAAIAGEAGVPVRRVLALAEAAARPDDPDGA